MEELYNLIFLGKVRDGVTIEKAKQNMVIALKLSHEKIEEIFVFLNSEHNAKVVLIGKVNAEIAKKQKEFLFRKVGIICEIQKIETKPSLELMPIEEEQKPVICPKCQHENPPGTEQCQQCGVVIATYLKQIEKEQKLHEEKERIREAWLRRKALEEQKMQEQADLEEKKRIEKEIEAEMKKKYKNKINPFIHIGYILSLLITVGSTMAFYYFSEKATDMTARALLGPTEQAIEKITGINKIASYQTIETNIANIAQDFINNSDFETAEAILALHVDDMNNKIKILLNIALKHEKNGNLEAAQKTLKEALAIAQNEPDIQNKINSLDQIAKFYENTNQPEEAKKIYDQMFIIVSETRNPIQQTVLLASIGQYYNTSKLEIIKEQSAILFKKAIANAEKIIDKEQRAMLLISIAKNLFNANQIKESEKLLEEIKKIAQYNEKIMMELAIAQFELGNFQAGLNSANKIKDENLQGQALYKAVLIQVDSQGFAQAMEIVHNMTSRQYKTKAYALIGEHQSRAGLTQQAQLSFKQATTLIDSFDNVEQKTELIGELAKHYINAGDAKQGSDLFEVSYELTTDIADPQQKDQALANLAKNYALSGNIAKSKALVKNITDSTLKAQVYQEITDAQDKEIKLQSLQILMENKQNTVINNNNII